MPKGDYNGVWDKLSRDPRSEQVPANAEQIGQDKSKRIGSDSTRERIGSDDPIPHSITGWILKSSRFPRSTDLPRCRMGGRDADPEPRKRSEFQIHAEETDLDWIVGPNPDTRSGTHIRSEATNRVMERPDSPEPQKPTRLQQSGSDSTREQSRSKDRSTYSTEWIKARMKTRPEGFKLGSTLNIDAIPSRFTEEALRSSSMRGKFPVSRSRL